MEISERLGEAERKYYIDDIEPTEEELRLLKLEDDLKNPKLSRDEKKDILFDLLFGDDKVREIYEKRYEVNSKLSEQTPVENNPIKQTKFNVIDFKKVFNIKNLIIKNKNIDLIQTEQEMMDNLKEMEQAKVLKQDRSNNKIKNNRDLEEK